MIGLLNVPCDTPAEYYSVPPNTKFSFDINSLNESLSCIEAAKNSKTRKCIIKRNSNSKTQGDWMAIFNRHRRLRQINYLKDGRKVLNGQLAENSKMQASQLWEQLLVRSVIQKIEDDVDLSAVNQFCDIKKHRSMLYLRGLFQICKSISGRKVMRAVVWNQKRFEAFQKLMKNMKKVGDGMLQKRFNSLRRVSIGCNRES